VSAALLTQPNTMDVRTFESHTLPLPQCCPVSGNPQPGSTLTIRYRPKHLMLEVYSLKAYVDQFIGGYENVRDMEGMIQTLAKTCAATLGVYVRIDAQIILQHGDAMRVVARAIP